MKLATKCAICLTEGNARLLYSENLGSNDLSVEVFSARRRPDRMHFSWVRCLKCGLLRSDPVAEIKLEKLYEESTFDYSFEVSGITEAYKEITQKALGVIPANGSILEIGGGNGFFLREALKMGFTSILGIEPSKGAVALAEPEIKTHMIVDVLRTGIVPDNSFDVVVMFHVLDHLPDPLESIKLCEKALKPGGKFIVAVHNEKSWSAKFLRNRSPIFDVEHTYLYSKVTGKELFEKASLIKITAGNYSNKYSLSYLIHLLPINNRLKSLVLDSGFVSLTNKIRFRVPLGNMWIAGSKKLGN